MNHVKKVSLEVLGELSFLNQFVLTKKLNLNFRRAGYLALVKTILLNLPVIIALVMLGIAPVFILQDPYIANQIAGVAFYLLIAGVIWKILQYLLNRHRYENERPDNKVEKQT